MFKVLILCLSALCLAQAYSFQRREGEAETETESKEAGGQDKQKMQHCREWEQQLYDEGENGHGQYQEKPFGPKDLVEGIEQGRKLLNGLSYKLDAVKSNVTKKEKTDKDWFGVLTGMADTMADGRCVFRVFAFGSLYALHRMFEGDHHFEQNTWCTYLEEATKDPKFGQKDFLSIIEENLVLDLDCFKKHLIDMESCESKFEAAHELSEEDVVKFISKTIEKLFVLRNDGERFWKAVKKTTEAYKEHKQGIQDFYKTMPDKEELVRELLRALQARK